MGIIGSDYEFLLYLFSPNVNSTIAIGLPIVIIIILFLKKNEKLQRPYLFIGLCLLTILFNSLNARIEESYNIIAITWIDGFLFLTFMPHRIITNKQISLFAIFSGSFLTMLITDLISARHLLNQWSGVGGAGLFDGILVNPIVITFSIYISYKIINKYSGSILTKKIFDNSIK
jgi:hypothetical protein